MEAVAYFNGAYVPYAKAQLPLHDAGIVWGATITDRVRTFRQEPFRLGAHLERFARSCELAKVPLDIDTTTLTAISHEVLTRNKAKAPATQEFSLVYLATPGPLPNFAPLPTTPGAPTLIVYALPLHLKRFQTLWAQGASLRAEESFLGCDPAIKHRSRLPWWISQQKVRKADPNAEPLFVSAAGEVLETTTANFLAVKDDALVIPPHEQILNGISLDVVRELARSLHIATHERPLLIDEIPQCSEALLVNMSFCMASVTKIDHVRLPHAGPMFRRLVGAWSEMVGAPVVPS